MHEDGNPIPLWRRQDLPPTLSRRFEFATYSETRSFLDEAAKVSEAANYYPNLSFGKTYVSVTIDADGNKLGPEALALAQKIDALVPAAE